MKSHILAAALASIAFVGGIAMAQTARVPSQLPNLSIAPATMLDVNALQQRVQHLESAQAAMQVRLDAAEAQLTVRRARTNALRQAVLAYAHCERHRVSGGNVNVPDNVECTPNNGQDPSSYMNLTRFMLDVSAVPTT